MAARSEWRLFLRVHRGAIARVDRVRDISPEPGGERLLTLQDGTRLTASRSHRRAVRRLLGLD